MTTIPEMKTLIMEIIETFDPNEEFDTKLISKALKNEHGFSFPIETIRRLLPHMNLSRRRLTKEDTECWRRLHGSRPKRETYIAGGFDSKTNAEFIRYLRYAKRSTVNLVP